MGKGFPCCDAPSLQIEHFAFRWGEGYSCFGGFFPALSCVNCGTANVQFGTIKSWLFDLLNVVAPWDGAMCQCTHEGGK